MRVILKPDTISKIEDLAGEKMSTRCDGTIRKALGIMEDKSKPSSPCWLEDDRSEPKEDKDAQS